MGRLSVYPPPVLDRDAVVRPRTRVPDPRQLAAHAGLPVARTYWPCLLNWVRGDPSDAALERMRRAARRRDRSSMLVPVAPRMQVLLLAEDSLEGASREDLDKEVSALLEVVRDDRPEALIHAVVGQRIDSDESVATTTLHLREVERYALAREGGGVAWAPDYSFACLLETLDARHAYSFIQGQLARLVAHDRENGTDLQHVLELALDHYNRNAAADAAFMHRNTFRRKLRTALDLVDADLDCPEDRLALHLALKLRARGDPTNGTPRSRSDPRSRTDRRPRSPSRSSGDHLN